MTSPDKQAVSGIAGIPSAAHAQAPWVIVDGGWLQSERGPLVDGRYFSLCITATSEADRNLLIAAPELLEALSWFINDIDDTRTCMFDFDANVQRSRAAIAKARGQ